MAAKQRALSTAATSVPAGRVVLRAAEGRRDQRYYIYRPATIDPQQPILVAVHGISINARNQARLFAPLAERAGAILIAPVFEPQFYPDYQRLGRVGLGQRADLALDKILSLVIAGNGVCNRRINLFGYSGGAQFAHRYAMVNPQRVNAQVLASAGWYTFPDQRKFPYGIKCSERLPEVHFERHSLLSVDTLVAAGTRDTERDPALRTSRRVDKRQGRNRLERGQRWIEAMRKSAQAEGLAARFELIELPGCGHDFDECMHTGRLGDKTFEFFYSITAKNQAVAG